MSTMGFDKVRFYEPRLVKNVADKHIRVAFDRITKDGKDADGRVMKRYTKEYASLKRRGFMKIGGKRAGKLSRYKTLAIKSYQTYPPNLMVTGTTMRNLLRRSYSFDSYTIGWAGEEGAIIKGQKERGRDVVSGIPQAELDWVLDKIYDLTLKELDKIHDTTINIG